MTINPKVRAENNTAWLPFTRATAVNPPAAATMAQIKLTTKIIARVVKTFPPAAFKFVYIRLPVVYLTGLKEKDRAQNPVHLGD